MAHVVVFARREGALPALSLLDHRVTVLPPTAEAAARTPAADALVIDGVVDLAGAKSLCRLLADGATPVIVVLAEGGLAAISHAWGASDVVLDTAGPGEVDARLRLAIAAAAERVPALAGGLAIDEASYQAKIDGRPLDLTYKEFELLRFLAAHPSRAFTREQLLSEVWGYDYYGGTRTVDVHVRRLRAKLGDLETAIGTVRGVGYRFELVDA